MNMNELEYLRRRLKLCEEERQLLHDALNEMIADKLTAEMRLEPRSSEQAGETHSPAAD